jgi:hypothetical protein
MQFLSSLKLVFDIALAVKHKLPRVSSCKFSHKAALGRENGKADTQANITNNILSKLLTVWNF